MKLAQLRGTHIKSLLDEAYENARLAMKNPAGAAGQGLTGGISNLTQGARSGNFQNTWDPTQVPINVQSWTILGCSNLEVLSTFGLISRYMHNMSPKQSDY